MGGPQVVDWVFCSGLLVGWKAYSSLWGCSANGGVSVSMLPPQGLSGSEGTLKQMDTRSPFAADFLTDPTQI